MGVLGGRSHSAIDVRERSMGMIVEGNESPAERRARARVFCVGMEQMGTLVMEHMRAGRETERERCIAEKCRMQRVLFPLFSFAFLSLFLRARSRYPFLFTFIVLLSYSESSAAFSPRHLSCV